MKPIKTEYLIPQKKSAAGKAGGICTWWFTTLASSSRDSKIVKQERVTSGIWLGSWGHVSLAPTTSILLASLFDDARKRRMRKESQKGKSQNSLIYTNMNEVAIIRLSNAFSLVVA